MMNKVLKYISEWFRSNKISLNASKTRYTFFHKPQIADNIPQQLPPLYIIPSYIASYINYAYIHGGIKLYSMGKKYPA